MGGAATTDPQIKPHNSQRSSPNPNPTQTLAAGSLVEVRTTEDGFKWVFFTATVISADGKNSVHVEYRDLLDENDQLKRLRERVHVSCVRPVPPVFENLKGFKRNDAVDVFHRDGWWIGAVTRVLEGGERFLVKFQDPPDVLECGVEDIRVHLEWVDETWILPGKKSKAGLMFDVGRKAEVSFDREDSLVVWFPATIKNKSEDGTFLVEYGAGNTDNVQTLPGPPFHKVKVDSLHIRPPQPYLDEKNFSLFGKVDAFFDFGWWSGLVTKELGNSRYEVTLKPTKVQKEFHHQELRPHMEWKDEKWFMSSQELQIPSSDDGELDHLTPENPNTSAETFPASNLGDNDKLPSLSTMRESQQVTPDNLKTLHMAETRTKRKHDVSDSQKVLSQTPKKLKEGNLHGSNQLERCIKEKSLNSLDPVSVNNNAEISVAQTATGDHSADNPSWGRTVQRQKRNGGVRRNIREKLDSTSGNSKSSGQMLQHEGPELRQRKKLDVRLNAGEKLNSTPRSSNLKRHTQMASLESPELNVAGKEPNAVGITEVQGEHKHAKEETEIPVIIGLPCAEMGSPVRHHNRKDQNDSTIQELKDSNQSGELSERKKRGRPRKLPIKSIQTPVTGDAQSGVVGSDDLGKKDDSNSMTEVVVMEAPLSNPEKTAINKDKETASLPDPKRSEARTPKRSLAKMNEELAVRKSTRLSENSSLKRGRRRVTDSTDASAEKTPDGNGPMEVEKAVMETPNNKLDDEPLSKWIQGIHTASAIDASRASSVITVEQCRENGEKQKDNGDVLEKDKDNEKQPESVPKASALGDEGLIVLKEPHSLPFVKNTVLWKTIESLEAFKRIPQRPHFEPLNQFKESAREGLAIGHMVTFNSVVERTSKLQFDDPKSATDDILETLADLESHGFNVRPVQDRVTELLAVKDKEEKLVDKVKEINNQISEHDSVKNRFAEEIREISERIRELQETLSVAESAKRKEDEEIASLQGSLKETEEGIKSVRLDFEGIVSSAL